MLQLQPQALFTLPVRRGTSGDLMLRIKKLQRAETANRMNGRVEAGWPSDDPTTGMWQAGSGWRHSEAGKSSPHLFDSVMSVLWHATSSPPCLVVLAV